MSAPLQEMPILPLPTVLLPYQALPLLIVEPHHLAMIRHCLEHDRNFGIVLLREAESEQTSQPVPYLVGTSARIVSHKDLPDGKMQVLTLGEGRFRIRKLDYTGPYPVALVEPVVEWDAADDATTSRILNRAKEAFSTLLQALFGRQGMELTIRFTNDPVALSFAMAACVQMSSLQRQRLIEITDTVERLREIIPLLETQALKVLNELAVDPRDAYGDLISKN